MSEPEFYANATLGFRQWYFSAGGEEPPVLRGVANPLFMGLEGGFDRPCHRWSVDGVNHAGCARLAPNPELLRESHGDVPGIECMCRFYAYGRRVGRNSETGIHIAGDMTAAESTHLVGGVIAAWGNLELHEHGFRCATAKILALFEPNREKGYADREGMAVRNREALRKMCAENAIPLLAPDALRDDEEVRRYARERSLALLEDQIARAI